HRLKLAHELGRTQKRPLFVFDEPTVGLHPDDVRVLIRVFQRLLDQGGTGRVVGLAPPLIADADDVVIVGPGGGADGGGLGGTGSPHTVARQSGSLTGRYLSSHLDGAGLDRDGAEEE